MNLRCSLCLLIVALIPMSASAQKRRDAHVIFKDDFYVKGIVNESVREFLYDRDTGMRFPVFSGQFFLHDHVRDVLFSTAQVIRVVQPKEFKPAMRIVRFDRVYQTRDIQASWQFTDFGKWNDVGERIVQVKTPQGDLELKQRVGIITPHYVFCATNEFKWNLMYFTDEFGPELTRKIVLQIFSEKKEYKALNNAEKYLKVAEFMLEAGWFKEAENELVGIIENFPDNKTIAQEMLARLKAARADLFVEGLTKASKIGQHQVAIGGLDSYDREGWAKIVSADHRLQAQDLRARYDKLKTDMDEIRAFLKVLPSHTKTPRVWVKACEFIDDELNRDTAGRLEEFLLSAQQFELERKNKRELSQSAEKVLATAISGWLQGTQAALPDPAAALKMAAAREFMIEYLKSDSSLKRSALLSGFKRDNDLPMDVLTRLARMIGPAVPFDLPKDPTEIQTIPIEAPDSEGGSYLLQLPPDYHPLRPHPVLILLHSGRDKPDEMLRRFSDEAAKQGFILVAPHWAGKAFFKARYQHSVAEHRLVLDTLRDVRRRFQVDSDRVFLSGWEDGANMAFDVALGHPDQFAGVAPMNGGLLPFTRKFYWPNAQYLPFYIMGGERDGHSFQIRKLLKDWTREPYASMYVEYKGRTSEWYGLEVAKMMSWMRNKKRLYPMKEMGRPNRGALLDEEFHSSRAFDNRFYWLRGDNFAASTQNDHRDKTWPGNFRPATLQANLSVGNKSDKDDAKIWNQLNLRVTGMRNVSFWITPGMFEMKYPLSIVVDGKNVGGMRKIEPSLETMLEELYQTGDRQRLFVAKVDIKL